MSVSKYLLRLVLLPVILISMVTDISEAMPAFPGIIEVSQPSGQSFDAKLKGDEWGNWVATAEDNLVVVEDTDGYWKYGQVSFGELIPSSAKVGIDPVPEKVVTSEVWQVIEGSFSEDPRVPTTYYSGGTAPSPTVPLQPAGGPQDILVFLVSFSDATISGTDAYWSNVFFGDSGDTVKNYFKENSGGSFYFTAGQETRGTANDGVIPVTLSYAHPNTGSSTGDANRQIVKDALIAADGYVDFSTYDDNSNGYIDYNELHVVTITAGYERSYNTQTPSVWGHRWSLGWTVPAPVLDGKAVALYPYGGYTQQGENHGDHKATIGILSHELGHDLGLFDLYNTDTGASVVGVSSLMDVGSWGRGPSDHYGASPAHMDPWAKQFLNFATPTVVSSGTHALTAASTGTYNFLRVNTSDANQYFLIENRNRSGFDDGLYYDGITNGGIAIWHIDESIISTYKSTNKVNGNGHSPGVWLEKSVSSVEPYFRSGGPKDTFSDATTPNSRLNNGSVTNITAKVLDPTALSMRVQLGQEASMQFSASTYSVAENGGSIAITVTRTSDTSQAVSVNYSTSNGTATAGTDYVAASGTLNFAIGETSKTFTVNILDDALVEGNETVNLTLSNPLNGALGSPSTATLTITENDVLPTVSLSSATYSVGEGNAVTITVNRSGSTGGSSSVNYSTSNGIATSGTDYTSTVGTLTFGPGETSKTFAISTLDDQLYEGNETVNIILSGPVGATLGATTSAVLTILDSENCAISFNSSTYLVNEGSSAVITLQRSNIGSAVTIDYTTSDGTATAGSDYTSVTGTVSFAVGEASKTFVVDTLDDLVYEGNETINLSLTNPQGGAGLGSTAVATLTILDNESPPTVAIASATYNVTEGGSVNIIVNRSGDLTGAASVNYATSNATAIAGSDYTAVSGVLTFNSGEASKTISINTLPDSLYEGDESFTISLTSPSGTTIGAISNATVTVVEDDNLLRFTASSYSVTEGNSVNITVERVGNTTGAASVFYATGGGNAQADVDYTSQSGTLSFAPGETSKTIALTTIDDSAGEGNESLNINLSSASGGVLTGVGSRSSTTVIINDNEPVSGTVVSLVLVSPGTFAAVPAGGTTQAIINGVYPDGSQGDITSLCTWVSSNPEVASVAADGRITGVNAGTTVVTASYNGLTKSITVSVR